MLIVDRFEGEYAVCKDENKKMINNQLESLPNDIKEGDCVEYINGEYKINVEVKELRKIEIDELTKTSWN